MNWLLRPSVLVLVSVALALTAAVLVLWPRAPENKAIPLQVNEGDREIVWLYLATTPAPWERFVTAVNASVRRLQADQSELHFEIDDRNSFPRQTTTVPELAVSSKGTKGKLWFRWYKITSEMKTAVWVKALLERRPAPMAIIGGSTSEQAIRLAHSLKEHADRLELSDTAPLLLLTTATVDEEPADEPLKVISLNSIYAGHTYRFCFTNRQMAEAVVDFIWSQSDLRPDGDPAYVTFWNDDPYSRDLTHRFLDALYFRAEEAALQAAARDWGNVTGSVATGAFPLDLGSFFLGRFTKAAPISERIPYGVGTFDQPNRWERESARDLMDIKIGKHPEQRRPLLVIPAASQPARRFLRALERLAPEEARRFVVATGDGIAFNTVYRDRDVAWPIQDLPFSLVFFCHRNPLDSSAAISPTDNAPTTRPDAGDSYRAGTEDLLLFVDIVDTLLQARYLDGSAPASTAELKQRLSRARWQTGRIRLGDSGQLLFDQDGNRRSGTGEHVVSLRPSAPEQQIILPESTLEVWSRHGSSRPGNGSWKRDAIKKVDYEATSGQDVGP